MKPLLSSLLVLTAFEMIPRLASAQPVLPPEELNVLVLVDISGSMSEPHGTSGNSKLDDGLAAARTYINSLPSLVPQITSVPGFSVEYGLWAFTDMPDNSQIIKIRDFPGYTKDEILADLGANGTPNAALMPLSTTPFAAAACAAASRLVGDADINGTNINPGYEYGKTKAGGVLVRVQKRLYVVTDGLENSTPLENECYAPMTSSQPYTSFESDSWQFKVRNKLLTGNPDRTATFNSGLVVDVNLVFSNWLTGLARVSSEGSSYAKSVRYTTEPDLQQAVTLYSGLTEQTGGQFKAISVNARGEVDSRYPGDVDYSGCVSEADYDELLQWYGTTCSPDHPHCYWADLDGNGVVDDFDYLMLAQHWYEGPTC